MANEDNNDSSEKKMPEFPGRQFIIWAIFIGLFLLLMLWSSEGFGRSVKKVTYSELRQLIEQNKVKSLTIEKATGDIKGELYVSGESADAAQYFTSDGSEETIAADLAKLLNEHNVTWGWKKPHWIRGVIESAVPILLIAVILYFFVFRQIRGAGGGGILSFGKSRAVRVTRDHNRKTFEDVAGIQEAKEEVSEIIEFLRNPEKFQKLGGRLPKGVLLVGSPGTGKTLLARAIAGEADVPFFSISGSDFVEMFVGVGASRVRDLFDQAKAASPCIIFLDEIDAIGRKRVNDVPGGGQETAQTLNAILVEMDGFTSDDKVIVVSATNRPDVLDPALLRPGRFDRQITVDLPNIEGREAILKVHTRKVKLGNDVDLKVIARGTPTFSGAELENVVNEAALLAAMKDKTVVDMACFEESRDKVRWGREKRSRKMADDDRRLTAVHEAGHALIMWHLPESTPLHKVTIIPRGRALGATMQLPEKDEYNMTRRRILGEIAVSMGGRVAEELFLDDISNGASSDIERATQLARAMVCEWGMSEELGVVFYGERRHDGFFDTRDISEATAQQIDDVVRAVIDQCYKDARNILKEHEDQVQLLVSALMEFELLSREEVRILLDSGLEPLREYRLAAKASEPVIKDEIASSQVSAVEESSIVNDTADAGTSADSSEFKDSDQPSLFDQPAPTTDETKKEDGV